MSVLYQFSFRCIPRSKRWSIAISLGQIWIKSGLWWFIFKSELYAYELQKQFHWLWVKLWFFYILCCFLLLYRYGNLLSIIFRAESLDQKLSFARCQSSVPFSLELQYQFLIWCKISRTFEMLCSQLVVCLTNCKFHNLNFLSVHFLKGCSKWYVQEKIILVLWSFIQCKCMLINLVNVFIRNVKSDSFYWTFHTCLTRG